MSYPGKLDDLYLRAWVGRHDNDTNMKSKPRDDPFINHLLELMVDFGSVNARRMFGGHGIFRDGLMFGLVADGEFYVKADDENRDQFVNSELSQFAYDKAGKTVMMSYYALPESALEDADEILVWVRLGFDAALRGQQNKSTRKKKVRKRE